MIHLLSDLLLFAKNNAMTQLATVYFPPLSTQVCLFCFPHSFFSRDRYRCIFFILMKTRLPSHSTRRLMFSCFSFSVGIVWWWNLFFARITYVICVILSDVLTGFRSALTLYSLEHFHTVSLKTVQIFPSINLHSK